jgi:hypothetical protein
MSVGIDFWERMIWEWPLGTEHLDMTFGDGTLGYGWDGI